MLQVFGGLLVGAKQFQITVGGVSVDFERRISGDRVGKHKAPSLSPVNMEITASVSLPVDDAVLIDYFPKDWTILDARGGTVSEYDENYNKIEWRVGKVSDSVTRSYVFKSPKPTSLQPKKYSLRSELIYDGGKATGEDWVEILIEKAVHLDENRNFVSDISEEVKTKDGVWSEPIYEGEWVRVLFQKELNPKNDITIYVRNTQGLNTWVEVYYPDSSEKIAEFPVITGENYYKVYLTNMSGNHDTFDLKIVNSDPETAYLEFDHIVDPQSYENFYPVTTETVYEGGTDNFAAAQMYNDGNYENIFENDYDTTSSQTYYFSTTTTSGFGTDYRAFSTSYGAVNTQTIWKDFDETAPFMNYLDPLTSRTISGGDGTPSPTALKGYGWRTSGVYGDVIPAGTWQFHLRWRSSSTTGTVYLQIWVYSCGSDGTNVTNLFSIKDTAYDITEAGTGTTYTYTYDSSSSFDLTNKVLVVEIWDNVVVKGGNNATLTFEAGSNTSSMVFPQMIHNYRENVQHNITGISGNFDNYRLEIGYYLAGDSEPVSVYLYNFSTGQWENIGNLTSATYQVFTYDITGTNLIDNVNGEVRVRYVQPDNDGSRTSLMIDYAGIVAVKYEWHLIESWTGTVSAPLVWNLIESWAATVRAPAQWHLIETWSGTISAPAEWHLIETWSGTVKAPAQWNLIETWTATVRASAQWHLIESWTGTVKAPLVWNLIESWAATVQAPAQWHLIETWSVTIAAPAEWYLIESWSGTVRVILGKPILLTPANGEKTKDDTPTFTWIPALNAENHRLLVSSSPDFSSIIENRLFGPTDNTYTPDPENYFADGLYYWKVVAINFAFKCRENESDVWEFRVDTTKPGAPTPVSPPHNATIDNDDQPLFTWTNTLLYEPSGGTYTLIIDNDPDFSSPIYYKEGILDNEHEIENKLTENFSPYYWKVRAVDNAGNMSDWSSRLKFTLKVPPSSSVDAISPYWQKTSPLTISATATDNDGAVVKVELWYRYSPDNSSWSAWKLFDNDFASPYSWSFTFPDNNGYYEFYTRALDDRGNYEISPAQADTRCGFDNTPPTKPTLVSPENNYTTTSTTPTFKWTAVSDLSGVTYELLIDNEPDFTEPYVYYKTNITDNQHTCENALDLGYYYWRVRAVDNAGNYGDWAEWYKVEIVPYQWNLIESWTGTVKAPAAWNLIESWTGTVKAPLFWNLIESWSGTVRAPTMWNLIESWTATVSSPAEWHLIESWTATVSASAGWNLIESWTAMVSAPAHWNLVESWAATVQAPAEWYLIETWSGTVRAPVEWSLIESWTGTVQAPAEWHLVESLTATVQAPAEWHLVETWTATIKAPLVWHLVDTWTATIKAPTMWNLVESWIGVVRAPAMWQLVETWATAVRAPGIPSSSVNAITPYWENTVPFTITVTASDPSSNGYVVTVTLWYRYSENKYSWSAWENFGTDNASPWSSFTAPRGDGYYEFYSVAVDETGYQESTPSSADTSCGVDTVAPVMSSVMINDNAQTTSSTSVMVKIAASDAMSGVVQMQFSSDNVNWTAWEQFATSKPYTLPTGDGIKTVYVRVKDNAGLISEIASDSITLVTIPHAYVYPVIVSVGEIPAGSSSVVSLESYQFWMTKITITASGNVSNALIGVRQAPIEMITEQVEKVQPPSGIVYQFFWEIETNIEESLISSVKLDFSIARSWVEQNDIDESTIKLLRFSGNWQELPTQYLGSDANYFYYQATSPGLSFFTAVGERRAAPPVVPVPTPSIMPAPTVVPIEFFSLLAMSGALAGFSIIYSLARPSKFYRVLKKLERAVAARRRRRVEKPIAKPALLRKETTVAELSALRRLRRIARRKMKTTKARKSSSEKE